jgi:hypothetical protein
MTNITAQEYITSPLESFLEIQEGTTVSPVMSTAVIVNDEVNSVVNTDQEDVEISDQLTQLYDLAVDAYKSQQEMIMAIDPKFAARNAEVSAQFLEIALGVVNSKIKKRGAVSSKSVTNNNLFMANRNDLLKQMLGGN